MVIEIYGVDKYDLDLRPYFIHSNPECEIKNYIITSVFEQGERNETLSVTETKNLFKITSQGKLQLLDVDGQYHGLQINMTVSPYEVHTMTTV